MRAVAVVLIAGCGRVGFDPLDGPGGGVDGQTSGLLDGAARVAYRDTVMADGPVGYWRLGDTGASAADESSMTPGTFVGSCNRNQPAAIAGDSNLAAQFDGVSCCITLGNNFGFLNRAPYTVELWYRPADLSLYESLIAKQTRLGNMPDDGYMLFNDQGGVYVERSIGAQNTRTMATSVVEGTTYHFVGTYDGSELALYKDGALAVPRVGDTALMPAVATPAVIGAASQMDQMFVAGILDEVAIYPRALSEAQVARHYDIGANGP